VKKADSTQGDAKKKSRGDQLLPLCLLSSTMQGEKTKTGERKKNKGIFTALKN